MTRMRFDPSFVEDERWERLGPDALVLHMTAVAYTVRTSSDGLLSFARIRALSPLVADVDAVADRLIADGLWEQLDPAQVRVCQVRDDLRFADGRGDEQPSKAFVDSERERARNRKEAWRKRKADTNAVENPEGNAVPNGSQSSAEQSSAVQDPKGPSPAPHAGRASSSALASVSPLRALEPPVDALPIVDGVLMARQAMAKAKAAAR